jgi:hypothetical protein
LRWLSSTARRDIVRQRLRLSSFNSNRKGGRELVGMRDRRCLSMFGQRLAAFFEFTGSLFLFTPTLMLHLLKVTSMLS